MSLGMVTLAIVGFAGLQKLQSVTEGLAFIRSNASSFAIGVGSALLIALVSFMARYLSSGLGSAVAEFEQLQEKLRAQQTMLDSFRAAVSADVKTVRLEPDDRQALKDQITEEVVKQVPVGIYSYFDGQLREARSDERILNRVAPQLEVVVGRLKAETAEVRRRANINLIIGTTVAAVGLMFLLYYVFTFQPPDHEPWDETLVRAIPRLTLVAVIELLAYFFLGLYRFGTYEIKYYQNELTNVELWSAAYVHALLIKDAGLTKEMAKKLAGVERNFVLKKGESTAVAIKSAGEDESVLSGLRSLADLVRGMSDPTHAKEEKHG